METVKGKEERPTVVNRSQYIATLTRELKEWPKTASSREKLFWALGRIEL